MLDESGSIGSTSGAQQAVINGSKAFVNGLVDSGAQLAVIEFNSSARTVPLGSPATVYNNVTSQFASGPFANYISSDYDPSGYTNWEDALAEVGALNPKPELVVFLTDGDPTARGNGSGADSGFPNGSYLTMNPAFTQSNNLKASGLHMFAIGVGAALTNERQQGARARDLGAEGVPGTSAARGRLHGDLRLPTTGRGPRHDRPCALFGACQGDEARRRTGRRHRTRPRTGGSSTAP